MVKKSVDQLPHDWNEHWIQAEAAVQAEMDRDVLDEAAGLAEAELSHTTLLELLSDSLGAFIQVRVGKIDVRGVLTGLCADVSTGVSTNGPTNGPTGKSLQWLIVDDCHAINLGTVSAMRGLRRYASSPPAAHSTPRRAPSQSVQSIQCVQRSRLQPWLRNRIGLRIAVHSGDVVATGILCEVGVDYLRIHQSQPAEFRPLAAIDHLEVF